MNIFILDKNPRIAAQYQCDKHVNKMIVESAQMLANAYTPERLAEKDCPCTQKGRPRKHSYLHHPCSKWVLKSEDNWMWLLQHAMSLVSEKTFRTGKLHFTTEFLTWCFFNRPNLPRSGLTNFALAMPDEHKSKCPVTSYRTYYIKDKADIATWTKREIPKWFEGM